MYEYHDKKEQKAKYRRCTFHSFEIYLSAMRLLYLRIYRGVVNMLNDKRIFYKYNSLMEKPNVNKYVVKLFIKRKQNVYACGRLIKIFVKLS